MSPLLYGLWWLLAAVSTTEQLSGVQEYCFPKSFNATCDRDQIMIMQSAKYGRMNRGKCVTSDDHVGCYADVLSHVDRKCSGRHGCLINIPDDELHKLQPCPKDMFSYLEAEYACKNVQYGGGRSCSYPGGLSATGPNGYLASVVTEELGYGSHRCPWVIALPPGQRINITLLDFGVASRFAETGNMCHVYAKIKERGMASDITICGSMIRERSVYISETNKIEVHIMSFKMEKEPVYFALKYNAIGCTDPVAPPGAWLKRSRERAVITCNYTSQAWHIVCHGNEWFGELENCTVRNANIEHHKETLQSSKETFPYGLLVAVVTGVVLGVVIGIAMLSLVLACHRRRKKKRSAAAADATYGTNLESRDINSFTGTTKSYVSDSGYGYTHVCGLRAMYQYTQDQISSKDGLDPPDIRPDVHKCHHDYEGYEHPSSRSVRSANISVEPGTVLYHTYQPQKEGAYDTNAGHKYGTPLT